MKIKINTMNGQAVGRGKTLPLKESFYYFVSLYIGYIFSFVYVVLRQEVNNPDG